VKERLSGIEVSFQDKSAPFTQLIRNGGFFWCNADEGIVGAHAISSKRQSSFLQFEYSEAVSNDVVHKMRRARRLRAVTTPCYAQRGAEEFGWMMPNESFPLKRKMFHNVGGEFGAFVYTLKGARDTVRALRFPVMAA